MSVITGNIRDVLKQPNYSAIVISQMSFPVVAGGSLIHTDDKRIFPKTNGDFRVSLAMGNYWFSYGKTRVGVSSDDDDVVYPIESRIITAVVQSPTNPVGGSSPIATATTFGLVKINSTDPSPILTVGQFFCVDSDELLTIPNKSSNRMAWILNPKNIAGLGTEPRATRWDNLSVSTHDGLDTFKPSDTSSLVAGRWVRFLD